jgi:hypothetical protein
VSAGRFTASAGFGQGRYDSFSFFSRKVGAVKVEKKQAFEFGGAGIGVLLQQCRLGQRAGGRMHGTTHLKSLLAGTFQQHLPKLLFDRG